MVVVTVSVMWRAVAQGLQPLFDDVAQRHIQFQGFTPDLPVRSYICPEDVNYLTYPLGPYMNLSGAVIANNARYYVPLTCLENAGYPKGEERTR